MIDSLDLIIYNIKYIDFRHLRSKGIEIHNYTRRRKNGYQIKAYNFKYNNLEFEFSPNLKYLLIKTHPSKILNSKVVKVSDIKIYQDRVLKIVKELILDYDVHQFKILLDKIDYKVDIQFEKKEKLDTYIEITKKYRETFHYAKQKKQYDTSKYLTNKNGQIHINFYNKHVESKDFDYENTLRLEIQHNPAFIKAQRRKDKGSRENTICEYWNKEAMEELYFKKLRQYVYLGIHYKRKMVNELINNSYYSISYKNKLKKFVLMANRYGITYVEKNIHCYSTVKKYISMLESININPITIPDESDYDSLPNLYTMAKEIAEKYYYE